MNKTRLYCVRHGETLWNLEQRFQGHTDIELSDEGLRQARLISRRLQDVPISAVYSSTLKRASITAKVIADYHNLPVIQVSQLMEMGYGDWEGMMFSEINKKYGEQFPRWLNNPTLFQIPRGEAIDSLQERAVKAVNEIVTAHPGEQVVIVAHGIAIRTIIAAVLNLPLVFISRFRQDNAALNILEYSNGKGTVLALNDTCHLK
jgi:broad specificity phosphatase PhoE